MKAATINRKFKVTFSCGSRERSAVIEAPTPERAAVDALLQGKLPAELTRKGPIFWVPGMYDKQRWPEDRPTEQMLVWGGEDDAGSVIYSVEEVEP